MAPQASQSAFYAEHIRSTLIPALQLVEQSLAKVEYERAEYADLSGRLRKLGERGEGPEETMMELGAGIWVDAQVPDTRMIILDLGFDIHLEMPRDQAADYAAKRVNMLERRRTELEKKRAQMVWQIEQFHGAIKELDRRDL